MVPARAASVHQASPQPALARRFRWVAVRTICEDDGSMLTGEVKSRAPSVYSPTRKVDDAAPIACSAQRVARAKPMER